MQAYPILTRRIFKNETYAITNVCKALLHIGITLFAVRLIEQTRVWCAGSRRESVIRSVANSKSSRGYASAVYQFNMDDSKSSHLVAAKKFVFKTGFKVVY